MEQVSTAVQAIWLLHVGVENICLPGIYVGSISEKRWGQSFNNLNTDLLLTFGGLYKSH